MCFFCADATYAIPAIYTRLEEARYFYAILLPANAVLRGFVAQTCFLSHFPFPRPFPRTGLSYGLGDGYARTSVAIGEGDPDLDHRDLPVEVPRHEALSHQFHTMHFCFDFVATRLRRWYPLHRRHKARPPRYRDALTSSLRAMAPALMGLQGLALLRGGMTAQALRAAIASWHLHVSQAPSAVMLPMS